MILVKVKNSQSEMYMGKLFQSSFHVDDSITAGIKHGSFVAIKGDGKVAGLYGTEAVATLKYADATSAPVGVVYEETSLSQYTGAYDRLMEAEAKKQQVLLPYGAREDRAIGLLRKGVFEISNTEVTKYRHFRTVEAVLAAANVVGATVSSGSDITITIANSPVKVGEPVLVGGLKARVKTVSASTVVITALEDIAAATYKIAAPSLIGYPVYLNPTQATDGQIPFAITGTKKIGWIESPIAVRFDVDLAL